MHMYEHVVVGVRSESLVIVFNQFSFSLANKHPILQQIHYSFPSCSPLLCQIYAVSLGSIFAIWENSLRTKLTDFSALQVYTSQCFIFINMTTLQSQPSSCILHVTFLYNIAHQQIICHLKNNKNISGTMGYQCFFSFLYQTGNNNKILKSQIEAVFLFGSVCHKHGEILFKIYEVASELWRCIMLVFSISL